MDQSYYMREALKQASLAQEYGDVPVGAVIAADGEIIAEGYNKKEQLNDPTAHAEIIAIREAANKTGSWRLIDTSIYVTIEPCPMCVGAILQARIRNIVFGAPDPKSGAVGSVVDLTAFKEFNHEVRVFGGILEDECSGIIKEFFKRKR